MIINKTDKKSIRSAYGKTLVKLGRENKNIVVMDSDLACSTQTGIFAKEFPERFFDSGIAEQDMMATAAGLAASGKIPFVSTFAVFATGRTYDQIRNSICYPDFNVKIVATHGGITVGEDGASHQALEDIALMRNIPNMKVIVPADCKECEQAVEYAAKTPGPFYIRLPRTNVCDIFGDDYKFDFNKATVLKQGSDATVITNGETLAEVLEAAEKLDKQGYSVQVINIPVVKPIDVDTIISEAKKTNFVITVENHSIIGGLGSAVCETLAENYPVRVHRVGINDTFGQSGTTSELLEFYGLNSARLTEILKEQIDKQRLINNK